MTETSVNPHQRLFDLLIKETGPCHFNRLPAGFRFESTPGHGYVYLTPEMNQAIPASCRKASYEEDCDYAIPCFYYRHAFTREAQEQFIKSLANWNPGALEAMGHLTLEPGESGWRDTANEYNQHPGREYVNSAFGPWCFDVPEGMVYVHTMVVTAGQDSILQRPLDKPGPTYLVPEKVYQNRPKGINWLPAEAKPYKRDETYYSWSSYTQSTGKPRYK